MDERDADLFRDILEHGEELAGYLSGVPLTKFRSDRMLQLVTERLLEIVGEAATGLSDDARAAVPYDWRAVRGLRNILAHQYGRVEHDALYATATRELPLLLARVRDALAHE